MKFIITIIMLFFVLPLNTFASPIDDITSLTNEINSWAYKANVIISNIFAIMFLFGVIMMGYSKITKTGHIMKQSFGTMIWAPASYFIIQLVVITMFTVQENGVILLTEIVTLLQFTTIFLIILMILTGILFHFFYKLIRHPEFLRWSRRLWSGSIIILLATIFIPKFFG